MLPKSVGLAESIGHLPWYSSAYKAIARPICFRLLRQLARLDSARIRSFQSSSKLKVNPTMTHVANAALSAMTRPLGRPRVQALNIRKTTDAQRGARMLHSCDLAISSSSLESNLT